MSFISTRVVYELRDRLHQARHICSTASRERHHTVTSDVFITRLWLSSVCLLWLFAAADAELKLTALLRSLSEFRGDESPKSHKLLVCRFCQDMIELFFSFTRWTTT